MPDLTSRLLPKIKSNQISTIPLDSDMTLPKYDGLSLVNIPGTIASLLGVPDFGKPALDSLILDQLNGPYTKVILLLVDALGTTLLERLMKANQDLVWRRYFDRAVYSPITSVCPSTTASALTTLWTGQGPAAHGIIGYEMWAREFGMIMNNILHSAATSRGDTGGLVRSGFDPHTFVGQPLLGPHLRQHGVRPMTFIHSGIARSGLSTMQMEEVDIHTFVDEADLCVSLAQHVNLQPHVPEYIYVYYSDVDSLMHRYNAENPRVALQFEAFSQLFEKAFFNQISDEAANETLLILTGDHGSKVTPKYDKYDLANHPDLVDNLVMQPTCENRLAFLFIKPGRVADVRDYFAQTWPDDFILLDPDAVLEAGLFGEEPHKPTSRDRLGDLIAVSKGDAYLWWAPKPNPLAGRHGGLSDEEMLVPFYALPLSRIRQ